VSGVRYSVPDVSVSIISALTSGVKDERRDIFQVTVIIHKTYMCVSHGAEFRCSNILLASCVIVR
jgi:hypothetical protein